MAKKKLHPKVYLTKIYCDGNIILELETTKKELHVDIWSGNHPFYTGSQKVLDTEGRVERFNNKYRSNQIDTDFNSTKIYANDTTINKE